MLRVIKEVQPTWVIGENVRGLVSWGGGWYSTKCVLTWKGKDMKSNRLLFLLQASTHRTEGIAFGLLPTPTLQEYTNSTLPPSQITRSNLAGVLLRSGISPHSQLNPQFVEEMMGFPKNWTLLPFLNGETNQSKHTETQ